MGTKVGAKQRWRILERDGFRCIYCGARAPDVTLHVDHKIPRAQGGSDEDENLATSCLPCNLGKRDKLAPAAVELGALAGHRLKLREVAADARLQVAHIKELVVRWARDRGYAGPGKETPREVASLGEPKGNRTRRIRLSVWPHKASGVVPGDGRTWGTLDSRLRRQGTSLSALVSEVRGRPSVEFVKRYAIGRTKEEYDSHARQHPELNLPNHSTFRDYFGLTYGELRDGVRGRQQKAFMRASPIVEARVRKAVKGRTPAEYEEARRKRLLWEGAPQVSDFQELFGKTFCELRGCLTEYLARAPPGA
jgi:hypothetical protein